MKVITSGVPYIDIDAYAGIIAYAELLNLQGHEAVAASSARWNESISITVRSWGGTLLIDYVAKPEDLYTIIDTSDPKHFDTFVALDRVEAVIDHHPNFETYWDERLGEDACVEFIGAAATLVYEKWKAASLEEEMSVTSARLLICAILDNTLNFKAKVSTPRDVQAYYELLKIADLAADWTAQYFAECQSSIVADVTQAILDDMKQLTFKGLEHETIAIGQLVVWDAEVLLTDQRDVIMQTIAGVQGEWLMSIVSVSEGRNYFLSNDPIIQSWVEKTLGVQFVDEMAISDRLWLRKEIIKQDNRLAA